jgi:hypothetical protein
MRLGEQHEVAERHTAQGIWSYDESCSKFPQDGRLFQYPLEELAHQLGCRNDDCELKSNHHHQVSQRCRVGSTVFLGCVQSTKQPTIQDKDEQKQEDNGG